MDNKPKDEVTECPLCGKRYFEHLEGDDYECYDCGEIFSVSTECDAPECDPQAKKAGEMEEKFRKAAIKKYSKFNGDIDVVPDATVNLSEDSESITGAFVQAWVYVSIQEVKS